MAAKTVIGSSLVIDGEISGEDGVVVHGTVRGKISVDKGVVVERGAEVEAEIETDIVQVAGRLAGKVNAKGRVEITAEGKMVGDIRAPRILIADGALFRGHIEME